MFLALLLEAFPRTALAVHLLPGLCPKAHSWALLIHTRSFLHKAGVVA